jgi:3-deoxy-D-manno-octulosonate 8-phosphate phosphatase KdsC-like HAD superfamily phosphatase
VLIELPQAESIEHEQIGFIGDRITDMQVIWRRELPAVSCMSPFGQHSAVREC